MEPAGLPIEAVLPAVGRALARGRDMVLQAPPGAGKTTLVPLSLLSAPWLEKKRIVMLEPRRLAARAAATRMAALLGEVVGETVGYRIRMETRVGPKTRIEVVTEGILTRMLQSDPALEGVGLVIFDEFHERSLHADLGLAFILQSQALLRPDLRLMIMSATLAAGPVADLLEKADVVTSEGRTFPVETRYLPEGRPLHADEPLPPLLARTILRTLKEEAGSLLAFLPGGGEIRRTEALLRESPLPPGVCIAPLYGDLPREAQDRALLPAEPGSRKVVLATAIAETSLTIEGVRIVIDGGLMRVPRFDPGRGMTRLETVKVSKASAEQRRGRAGRTAPGICIRLWTEGGHHLLAEENRPEILEADLAPLALELARWGTNDPLELKWLTPPPPGAYAQARELLSELGALDAAGKITAHGREMAALPLHPRLAHMILKGRALGLGGLACEIAALLSERDILRQRPGERDSDVRLRIEALRAGRGREAAESAARLRQLAKVSPHGGGTEGAGLLLALAYPDRVGKRRGGGDRRYLLSNGTGAFFPEPEPLSAQEYIVAAHLDGGREGRIFLAAPLERTELESHLAEGITEESAVSWDPRTGAVAALRVRRFGRLLLESGPIASPDPHAVARALIEGIRAAGIGCLPWTADLLQWRGRIDFLRTLPGETEAWPDLSDEALMATMEEWLLPWLSGMNRLDHLKRLDLKGALTALLPHETRRRLDALAPTHITVPSGSRITVGYETGRPTLAVRLQEMFGLAETPRIAGGRVPLLIHLLSPAQRPLQVTEDLAGFWSGSYEAVRKEMRGRYPRHHWPDNPLEAEATRRAKPRKS